MYLHILIIPIISIHLIHILKSALPVTTILGKENATIFKQLIELGNFTDEFNALENVTFYAPTDKAFETNYWKKQLDENPASLKKNPDLREFLRNHIIAPMTKTCHLSNGMQKTLGEQEVRVNLYSTVCQIFDFNLRHFINKIYFFSNQSSVM